MHAATQLDLDHHQVTPDPPTVSDSPVPSTELTIERRLDAQSVILVLGGEVDLASALQMEQALIDAVWRDPPRIVIDLAAVEFIDSAGAATLIHAQRRASAHGHSLMLRHVPPQARRLFELTGVAGAFVAD